VGARYTFRTAFVLAADPAAVTAAVLVPEPWLTGLGHVRELDRLADGHGERGPRYRVTVAAALPPYRLRWELEAVRVVPGRTLDWCAAGDLAGDGTWQLTATDAGTEVVSTARLHTTRRWMNLLAPVARPLFVRNHDLVMRAGVDALARHLDAEVHRYDRGELVTARS
jgi:hypothetical protein